MTHTTRGEKRTAFVFWSSSAGFHDLFSCTIPIDDGAAPNPFGGICTLTICKPAIRRKAAEGDWVVGLGSKRASRDFSGRVVYAMKVTRVLTMQKYDEYCASRLPIKLPEWNSSRFEKRVGDCIYAYSGKRAPKLRLGIHHTIPDWRQLGEKTLHHFSCLISGLDGRNASSTGPWWRSS
ncbi:MAG: hypothetical protein IAE94_06250 [Chthoniobacterales bacterium]|nr:hypothetical protein [Chthoniobacterales bacterium]